MVKPMVHKIPSTPDGYKHSFNCCANPDVRYQSEKSEVAECENCGHDWSDSL